MAGRVCAYQEGPTPRNFHHGLEIVRGLYHEAPTRLGACPPRQRRNSMADRVCVHKEGLFARPRTQKRKRREGEPENDRQP